MKRLLLTAMLIVLALTLAAPCAMAAGDRIIVENELDETILFLYISPSASDSWDEDVLDDNVLSSNGSLRINFTYGINTRYWDLKIITMSGEESVWEGIDLYEYSTLVIYEDVFGEIQAYGQ